MSFQILTHKEFQNFSGTVPECSFMQTPEMAILLNKLGCQTQFIGLQKNGQVRIAALLHSMSMTGGLHMEINSGPIYQDSQYLEEFYQKTKNYAKQSGALELIIKPYDTYQIFNNDGVAISPAQTDHLNTLKNLGFCHDGLTIGYPNGEINWHYIKKLTHLTSNTLLSSFSKNGKSLVKKAKTFGIQLKRLNRDELSIFKEITEATANRRKYTDKSLNYYQSFYDSFGDKADFMLASLNFKKYHNHLEYQQSKLLKNIDQLKGNQPKKMWSKKKKNQLQELENQFKTFNQRKKKAIDLIAQYGQEDISLAVSLFVYTPQEATYLFSGSYPEFNNFYAPALLQEYAMTQALKKRIPLYNFLGITGNFDGSDSILQFKKNFNGLVIRKMGTVRYYPYPLKAKFLKSIKNILRR